MKRTFKDYLVLSLKGMAMGAADVVPGVSGGTIAFISGIYEEFINSLKSFNLDAFKALRQEGIPGLWRHVNGNFLVALFTGIAISIVSLAKLFSYLLDHHPVLVWSFFFGLIVASVIFVGKIVRKWNAVNVVAVVAGAAIAWWITGLHAFGGNEAYWYVFLSGLIAICAMILPGISGSFILLILGSYQFILGSLKDFKIAIIAVFMAGCVTGLLSFSRLLSWLFDRYHDITVAILTGFLIGSLRKIWPWKHVEEVFVKHEGEPNEEIVNLVETNVLPAAYDLPKEIANGIVTAHTPTDPQLMVGIVCAIAGFVIIFALERLAVTKSE